MICSKPRRWRADIIHSDLTCSEDVQRTETRSRRKTRRLKKKIIKRAKNVSPPRPLVPASSKAEAEFSESSAVWFLLLVSVVQTGVTIQVTTFTVRYEQAASSIVKTSNTDASFCYRGGRGFDPPLLLWSGPTCAAAEASLSYVTLRKSVSGLEDVTFAVKWHKCSCRRKTREVQRVETFWSLVS